MVVCFLAIRVSRRWKRPTPLCGSGSGKPGEDHPFAAENVAAEPVTSGVAVGRPGRFLFLRIQDAADPPSCQREVRATSALA